METALSFILFWGVWLLVPALIDGLTTLFSLAGVLAARRLRKQMSQMPVFYPLITLIIPVYNSAGTLGACLRSLEAQDYPATCMEILVINNGSTDDSFDVFNRLQGELPLAMSWHSIINQGKSWALNAGIHLARGQYIFNIDSDVVLAPDAVRQVVETMERQPDLGAATGAVEVLLPPADAGWLRKLLGYCEYFEYLTAFHVGREYQTLLRSLYTLSGAFSIFRRDVLLRTFLYNQETITEDTDLTFELYERLSEYRIGCITLAVAYVHPIESLSALYAQRLRWQRGQVEVSARHRRLLQRPIWSITGFNPARILAIDHTLAFPRVVWTFLLPVLVLFGYSPSLIVTALIALYLFYLLIDAAWVVVVLIDSKPVVRTHLLTNAWILPILPLYRMLIFWFRFSGFLHAAAEPRQWRTQDPLIQVRRGVTRDWQHLTEAWRTWRNRG